MSTAPLTHAGAVVVREIEGRPKFLLISALDKPRERVLPKGHIRPGETPEAAALRELREETGVEGEVLAPLGTHEFDAPSEHVRAVFYLVGYLRKAAADETRELSWCSYDEASQRLTHGDALPLIAAARDKWCADREGNGSS